MARVLFIHGFLGHESDWDSTIRHCSNLHGYDFIALALPIIDGCDNISQYSEQLWLQLEAQGVITDTIHLVGYSMGARLAMHWLDKQQVKSALLEAGHPGEDGLDTKRLAHDLAWADKLSQLSPHQFLRQWYAQPIFASQQGLDMAQQSQLINASQQAYLLSTLSVAKQQNCSKLIACKPVTYLVGERDSKYQSISKALPVNKRVSVHAAGHNVHLSQPAQYLQHLTEHLREQYYDKSSA